MKIFISHSWRDKTTADLLGTDLSSMAEVWLDIEQLEPGDQIQPTIDQALAEMDLVVLLWSEYAAASKAVGAEIETSLRLGKTLIPCMLDETPLPEASQGTLGVDFHDYTLGFGRLCIVILRRLSADLGIEAGEELQAIKDVEGVLTYVQDYRNKQGIAGADRDHWIERITAAMNALFDRGVRLQERMRQAGDLVQQIYGKLQDAGTDRTKLQEVLQEVIRNEHKAPDVLRQVRGHIEKYIHTLPAESTPVARTQTFEQSAASLASTYGYIDDQARGQIEERLRGQMAPAMLQGAADLLHEYISSARQTLQTLGSLAMASQSHGAMQVVEHLFSYLENPNDLLPESQHGVWGYLDDAWLTHNSAYRLVEAGLAPASAFAVQWDRVASADHIATAFLPPMVRYELENYLNQMLALIASDVGDYAPQFAHAGPAYHPHMGEAPAVGGRNRELDLMYESFGNSLAQTSLDGWSASIDADYAAGAGYD